MNNFALGGGGGGSTSLYTLYRYVPPDRVRVFDVDALARWLRYKRPFKISLLNFITCSTVLTEHIFFVLRFEVDTAIK